MSSQTTQNGSLTTDGSAARDGLARLVNDVHWGLAKLFNHRARDYGLTRAHWQVISGLARRDGQTQTELADRLSMARSPLGKIVDRLEAEGWIERRDDPNDRRVNRLHLTDAVNHVLNPARQIAAELERAALAPLSDPERRVLIEGLDRVREVLHAYLAEEAAT